MPPRKLKPNDIEFTINDPEYIDKDMIKLTHQQMIKLIEYLKSNFPVYELFCNRKFKVIIKCLLYTAIDFTKKNEKDNTKTV